MTLDDATVLQIMTAVLAFMGTCFTGVMAYLVARLDRNQSARDLRAAYRVAEVKDTLRQSTAIQASKLNGLASVAKATHSLVNSQMAIQLKLNLIATRRLAELTQDPGDIRAAEHAKEMLRLHQQQQQVVDDQPGTDAEKAGVVEGETEATSDGSTTRHDVAVKSDDE